MYLQGAPELRLVDRPSKVAGLLAGPELLTQQSEAETQASMAAAARIEQPLQQAQVSALSRLRSQPLHATVSVTSMLHSSGLYSCKTCAHDNHSTT